MSEATTSPHDLEREIIARALKDPQVRAQLLSDPHTAIAAAFGVKAADGVQIRVIEQEPNTIYLLLPAEDTGELSEAELRKVAGGVSNSLLIETSGRLAG